MASDKRSTLPCLMSLYTSADNIRTDSSSDDRTSRGYTCFCLNTIAESMLKKQVRGLVKELHISFIDYFLPSVWQKGSSEVCIAVFEIMSPSAVSGDH